ncbi:hypothetical protein [Thalassomonas sp. RHCl1]|uniref:hypothetical protein n=1 Tax=Thalassomonas sp. RHCl1 TaxID=2995320 RepID=UPI00248B06BF|nr:hypothetical protein [Thalassomonas sp. RHCl1]
MLNLRKPQAPPTKEQATTNMLKRMGVANPQPRDMNRNVMLSQIENFNKSDLSPLVDQQRYMVSPHRDVTNFMANSRGMGMQALRDDHPMVRPIFKDVEQRDAFHQLAKQKLNAPGFMSATEKQTYQQLRDWSHQDNAMMDFSSVNTKRSHPVVFVQGHGSAGDKKIYSDAHEATSAKSVASMLDKMGLPSVSQLRANSCFSGTETDLSNMQNVPQKFREQTIEQSAGKWSKTFAGSLEQELNQPSYKTQYLRNKSQVDKMMDRPLGKWGQVKAFFNPDNLTKERKEAIDAMDKRHNRVVGYMGPTTQGAVISKKREQFGKIGYQKHTAVVFGPKDNRSYYKHGDVSRVSPSVPGK